MIDPEDATNQYVALRGCSGGRGGREAAMDPRAGEAMTMRVMIRRRQEVAAKSIQLRMRRKEE